MTKPPSHIYHHARELEHVEYGIVSQVKLTDIIPPSCSPHPNNANKCAVNFFDDYHDELYMEGPYGWIAERCGFWPLFLAVGNDEVASWMTGYFGQWMRIISSSKEGNKYREAGDFPDRVLFSFDKEPHDNIFFTDYDFYHIVLNSNSWHYDGIKCHIHNTTEGRYEKWVTKPQWDREKWIKGALSKAKKSPYVQAVVPELDLREATRIWCRSQKSKKELIRKGFDPDIIMVMKPQELKKLIPNIYPS